MVRFSKKNKRNMIVTIVVLAFVLTLLAGCSSQSETSKEPSIDEIYASIEKAVDLSSMKEGDKDKLNKLYEIDSDEVVDFKLYTADSNIKANELLILKAKDEKNLSDIEDKITKRIETQSSNFKDYLPDEYYLIEKHVLKTNNNYILFVISEDAEKIKNGFDEAFK